jgi:hypothetical protein
VRPCNWPGCPELVERGYCPGHQRERDRRHNAAPWRWVYLDERWRGRNGTRRRALRRAGFRCEVLENGERCTVESPTGAGLHADHTPLGVQELLEQGLDPFDDDGVRIACASHHARLEQQRRADR